jgi:hypothetical protein
MALLRRIRIARATVVATLLLAGLLVFLVRPSAGRPRHVALRIDISGPGMVATMTRERRCSRRCVWSFRRRAVVRLRAVPLEDARFVHWVGRCGTRAVCEVVMSRPRRLTARFEPLESEPTPPSPTPPPPPSPPAPPPAKRSLDNPHVACSPVLTTIPLILGSEQNAGGGATESGGFFQPHLAGNENRHLLNPPCFVDAEPTFVELRGVHLDDIWPAADGDYTGNLSDPSRPDITNPNMKTIHVEIDNTWVAAGVAPMPPPTKGMTIDLRGFVYWDPGHVDAPWHNYSGWEIHPISAWRQSS